MFAYATIRQVHTPSAAFDDARAMLQQAHLWDPDDQTIPEWQSLSWANDQRANFGRAAAFLSERLQDCASLTVLVDEVDVTLLNPLRSNGWSSLIAMLILAFPEVRWVFLVVNGCPTFPPQLKPKEIAALRGEERVERQAQRQRDWSSAEVAMLRWSIISCLHGAATLTRPRGSALFDGHGLRQVVLRCMRADGEMRARFSEKTVPVRPILAVVLDDETGFSQFEALMAYTRGFRVHAVASWTEAMELLGDEGWLAALPPPEKDDRNPAGETPSAVDSAPLN